MKYFNIFKNLKTEQITYFIAVIMSVFSVKAAGQKPGTGRTVKPSLNITVTDSVKNLPVKLANLILLKNNETVRTNISGPHGTGVFKDLETGKYKLLVHCIGYKDYERVILLNKQAAYLKVLMIPLSIRLGEVVVKGSREINISNYIDIKSGNQIISPETYHASPSGRMAAFIRENVTGAVRQPIGQMVVNDQHNGYSNTSYYLNGAPIPTGVLGSTNEIIDPGIIQNITTYTSGFPAEYGGQSAVVFDIHSRIPTSDFHAEYSSYFGSYLTSSNQNLGRRVGMFKALNSDGQSLSLSSSFGNLRYFLSGSRQETDRRLDQPVTKLFHDHGFDYYLFGKFDYLLSSKDFITTNLNYSATDAQIPYDSAEGINIDNQKGYNAFQTLSYYHTFSGSSNRESHLMTALLFSERGLNFLTNYKYDQTKLFLGNDSTSGYTLNQDRKYFTFGLRTKYSDRLSDIFKYETGFRLEYSSANELFHLTNFNGSGPAISSGFPASDFGVFVQTGIHPWDAVELDAGARYDQSVSQSIPVQRQVSPRLKLSLFINDANTAYLSYDRLFLHANVQGLNYLSQIEGGADSNSGTYPERDNLYEIGLIHNFNSGLILKLDYFHKDAAPGFDDEQLGSGSIVININIQKIKISGLELSLDYNEPLTPFSFYVNGSIIHGYGQGQISGGFMLPDYSESPYDLDHDQRLTLVTGLNYQQNGMFANLTINYGSGLTNGNDNYNYRTGLFEMNQGAHTTPAWILDLSFGYSFNIDDNQSLEPSVYITNLLDHAHLIKGAFFSGAYFEPRRDVVMKISYQL